MIDYIKGHIEELTPTSATVETNGIGYLIHISLNTYTSIEKSKHTKLFVYEAIKEDAYTLYGFSDKKERALFILLISVSGVGASTARMILSSLSVEELEMAIASGNESVLKGVKGIGLKTAQRIIVDLKNKICKSDLSDTSMPTPHADTHTTAQEAVSALVMLGFPQSASQKAVNTLLKQNPAIKIEQIIKQALKIL